MRSVCRPFRKAGGSIVRWCNVGSVRGWGGRGHQCRGGRRGVGIRRSVVVEVVGEFFGTFWWTGRLVDE